MQAIVIAEYMYYSSVTVLGNRRGISIANQKPQSWAELTDAQRQTFIDAAERSIGRVLAAWHEPPPDPDPELE